MEKSKVEAALKAFKADKISTYLCSNALTQELYEENKIELGKLAEEYLKKTYFKKHYTVKLPCIFLFNAQDAALSDNNRRNIRIKFLEWLIRTKL